MAVSGSLDSGSQLTRAVLALHYGLPLFVAAYYLIAGITSYFQSKAQDGIPSKKVLRKVVSWLILGVPITYVSYNLHLSRLHHRVMVHYV
jgi:hypothetical protein